MQVVFNIALVLHMVGFVGILATSVLMLRNPKPGISTGVMHSSLVQLVSGLALVGIGEASLDEDYNHVKITIKLVILLFITLLAVKNRNRVDAPKGVWAAIAGLTVVNALIAWLW